MSEEDLRDCFAMMKAITGASPEECYKFADEMLKARKPEQESGIVAIKPRRRKESTRNG
jgi:hypothetical protein